MKTEEKEQPKNTKYIYIPEYTCDDCEWQGDYNELSTYHPKEGYKTRCPKCDSKNLVYYQDHFLYKLVKRRA